MVLGVVDDEPRNRAAGNWGAIGRALFFSSVAAQFFIFHFSLFI
jgi:hypothetical protein